MGPGERVPCSPKHQTPQKNVTPETDINAQVRYISLNVTYIQKKQGCSIPPVTVLLQQEKKKKVRYINTLTGNNILCIRI